MFRDNKDCKSVIFKNNIGFFICYITCVVYIHVNLSVSSYWEIHSSMIWEIIEFFDMQII